MIKKFICKVFNLVPQSRYEKLRNALNNEISQLQKQLKENAGQYHNDLASLHAQIESLVSKKKALEEELSQANKRIAELTKANEILSHRIKDLESAISEERGNVQSKEIIIKSLKSENDSLKESVEKLESLLKNAEENLKEKELEYNNSIGRIEKEHYNLYQENLKNINAKNSLEEALKKQKEVFESEQNIKFELTLSNDTLSHRIKELEGSYEKLSKINAELTQSNDILSHRIKDFEKAISKERSNVLSKEINIKSLKSENDSLKESIKKLESLLKQAEEKKDEELNKNMANLKTFNSEKDRLNYQLTEKETKIKELQNTIIKHQALIAELSESPNTSLQNNINLRSQLNDYIKENEDLKNSHKISEFFDKKKILDLEQEVSRLKKQLIQHRENYYRINNTQRKTNIIHIKYPILSTQKQIIRLRKSNILIAKCNGLYFNYISDRTKLDKAYSALEYTVNNIYIARHRNKYSTLYLMGSIVKCLSEAEYDKIVFSNNKFILTRNNKPKEIISPAELIKSLNSSIKSY